MMRHGGELQDAFAFIPAPALVGFAELVRECACGDLEEISKGWIGHGNDSLANELDEALNR
jgi:hypothetical protein